MWLFVPLISALGHRGGESMKVTGQSVQANEWPSSSVGDPASKTKYGKR